jgi:hypothetical protein
MPPLALLAALGWQRTMAHRVLAGRVFAGICLVNIGMALALVLKVGDVTKTSRTQDVAAALACAATPADKVYVSDAYPYDLPFYAQTSKPLVVLENWPLLRKQVGDGWQRELFEGANFDAQAARVLQSMDVLADAAQIPGNWFVVRADNPVAQNLSGWALFYKGAGWDLYRSGGLGADASAAKSPEPAEHKSLPGCKDQRHK